jgi:hypothetical protein
MKAKASRTRVSRLPALVSVHCFSSNKQRLRQKEGRKGGQRVVGLSSTPLATVFRLLETQDTAGVKELSGEEFPAVVSTNRWTVYNRFAPQCRQLFWAHLKRDFFAFRERRGKQSRGRFPCLVFLQAVAGLCPSGHDGGSIDSALPRFHMKILRYRQDSIFIQYRFVSADDLRVAGDGNIRSSVNDGLASGGIAG